MDAFTRLILVAVMVALDTISQFLFILGTIAVLRISKRLWIFHSHKMDNKTQPCNPHRHEIEVNTAFTKQAETSNSEFSFQMKCKCQRTLKPDLQVQTGIEKSLSHKSYREYSIKDQIEITIAT